MNQDQKKPICYRVETPRFVAAVDTFEGRITRTAPILRWATGMYISSLREKLERRYPQEVKINKANN